MKFTGRAQIEPLTQFETDSFPVTSFYLDTDKSRLPKKRSPSRSSMSLTRAKRASKPWTSPGRRRNPWPLTW